MKRKIYQELVEWKNNVTNIKPLMLLGARQVGKTYIIREFCSHEFKNFFELNLLEREDIVQLYNENVSSEEKFQRLKLILNFDLEQEDTVLFIDEIQVSKKLISELKFFCEKHNKLRIIVAGSLLGVKIKRSSFSFPVGKVWIKYMYPMDFKEFLIALNRDNLVSEIEECYKKDRAMSEPIHKLLLNYYRAYLVTGGMPESVNNYVESQEDFLKYDKSLLKNIVISYLEDMDQYVDSKAESLKIEDTYNSIPAQLGNQSHKFQYSKIDENAKTREYASSIQWLKTSFMVQICTQVSNPEIPLKGFMKKEYFKMFLNDVGILVNNLEIDYRDIILDNLSLYKGVIAENYVANQLVANNHSLYYWVSSATAEIDFLITTLDGVIPIEVKASDNTKSKSLNQYVKMYDPKYSIKISSKNFGYVNGIKSVPLYAVFCINNTDSSSFDDIEI